MIALNTMNPFLISKCVRESKWVPASNGYHTFIFKLTTVKDNIFIFIFYAMD